MNFLQYRFIIISDQLYVSFHKGMLRKNDMLKIGHCKLRKYSLYTEKMTFCYEYRTVESI